VCKTEVSRTHQNTEHEEHGDCSRNTKRGGLYPWQLAQLHTPTCHSSYPFQSSTLNTRRRHSVETYKESALRYLNELFQLHTSSKLHQSSATALYAKTRQGGSSVNRRRLKGDRVSGCVTTQRRGHTLFRLESFSSVLSLCNR
jgi:hypothetical protein